MLGVTINLEIYYKLLQKFAGKQSNFSKMSGRI